MTQNKKLNGLGRKEEKEMLSEGYFSNAEANGYLRIIYSDGSYYTGWLRNGKYNGKGKKVNADGSIEDGEWKDGKFIG